MSVADTAQAPLAPHPRVAWEERVGWSRLQRRLDGWRNERGLILDAPFQRPLVWDDARRRAYLEYVLAGGEGGLMLTLARVGGPGDHSPPRLVLVDGKQRLDAVIRFLRGDLRVEDDAEWARLRTAWDLVGGRLSFLFVAVDCATEADVLRFYLDLNRGGPCAGSTP